MYRIHHSMLHNSIYIYIKKSHKNFLSIKSQVELLALVMPYKQLARVEQTRYYEEFLHSTDERLIESENYIFGGPPYRKRLITEESVRLSDLTQHTKSNIAVDPDWGYGTDINIDNVPLLLQALANRIKDIYQVLVFLIQRSEISLSITRRLATSASRPTSTLLMMVSIYSS